MNNVIFSKIICPLCEKSLLSNDLIYYCDSKHYTYNTTGISAMVISNFQLRHYVKSKETFLWKSVNNIYSLVCCLPLLEIDYSNTENVLNKLKLLVIFS